jgi:hypothetical protein
MMRKNTFLRLDNSCILILFILLFICHSCTPQAENEEKKPDFFPKAQLGENEEKKLPFTPRKRKPFFYYTYKKNPATSKMQLYIKIQTPIEAGYNKEKRYSALIPEAYLEGFIFGNDKQEIFCVSSFNDTFKLFDFSGGYENWKISYPQYDSVETRIGKREWVKFNKNTDASMKMYYQPPWGEHIEDTLYVLELQHFNTNYSKYSDEPWDNWRIYIDKQKGVVGMMLYSNAFACDMIEAHYACGKIPAMDMEGNFKWAFAYHSFYVNF